MKRFVYIIVLSMGIGNAQNAQTITSIKGNFSEKSIQVYKENSESKVKEFFEYLNMYSSENNVNLKKQIKENIYSLVENTNIKIPDFTTTSKSKIGLKDFLSKIESDNWKFEVSAFKLSEDTGINYWVNEYDVKIQKGGESKNFSVIQKIIFEPIEKNFGKKKKIVWTTLLGDFN